MIVEHAFITTLEPEQAMALASEYLTARGFVAPMQDSFPVGQEQWTAVELTRGKKNPARARSILELPQTVRLEWDRGRVTVALSITGSAQWGGRGIGGTERPKKMKLHERLLNAIAASLENLLAHDGRGAGDYAEWDAVENEARALARKRKIRQIILVSIIFGMLLLGIILIVVVGSR